MGLALYVRAKVGGLGQGGGVIAQVGGHGLEGGSWPGGGHGQGRGGVTARVRGGVVQVWTDIHLNVTVFYAISGTYEMAEYETIN